MKTQNKSQLISTFPKFQSKGFTIIEAIVSCVILGFVVFALINFFPTSSVMNARADRCSSATLLAEELIESFRATPFDTLKSFISVGNDSGSEIIDPDGIPGGWQFRRKWSLIDNGSIVQVEVQCSWPTPGARGSSDVKLVTQISNHD